MLSHILKELRKEKGLTQEQLADVLHVERSSIGKYESPTKPVIPTLEVLFRMSDYFGVSLDRLLGKEQPSSDADSRGVEFALHNSVSLNGLTEEQRQTVAIMTAQFVELNHLKENSPSAN